MTGPRCSSGRRSPSSPRSTPPASTVTRTDVHTFGLGFEVQGIRYPFLGPDAFGHSGAAGAQAFADPRSGVTYGYVRRRFPYPPEGGALENHRLAAAVIHSATAP